jgi:hypothetical protein
MIRLLIFLAIIYCLFGGKSTVVNSAPVQTPVQTEVVQSKIYDGDGCNVDVASNLVAEHEVGPITNLEEERFEFGARNECTVNYDIVVDGKSHHVDQTETGLEQMNSVCYYARERGRKDLLLSLGGKFNSHATVDCRYRDTIGKTVN